MTHFSNYNILSDTQFGFCKNYSAELQLIKVSHDLAHSLNNKGQTDVVLLDFSKAIDKDLHHLLLLKLQHYCIQGHILNWVSDFLSKHTQRVVCGGPTSKPINVTSRKCIKAIIIFNIHNDIYDNLSSSCCLFTDDCILYRNITSATDAEILQEDQNKLATWAKTWGMHFNIDKYVVLRVTLKHNPFTTE